MAETTTSNEERLLAVHPVEIYMALDMAFDGDNWLEWEPETILLSLSAKGVPDRAADKVLAVHSVAANSSMVLSSANAFEKVVMAFCNNVCVMDEHQEPYLEEVCYTVTQIRQIIKLAHPADGDKAVFHNEVPGYVAAVAKCRGWFVLPASLSFAQGPLDYLTGLSEGSDLRKEHEGIIHAVEALYHEMKTRDAEELLNSKEIDELDNDDTGSMLTKRIIGALLYDPTLPYKKGIAKTAAAPIKSVTEIAKDATDPIKANEKIRVRVAVPPLQNPGNPAQRAKNRIAGRGIQPTGGNAYSGGKPTNVYV